MAPRSSKLALVPQPGPGQLLVQNYQVLGRDRARAEAEAQGQLSLFEVVEAMAAQEPVPAFLHSALCAMSLPATRPRDEMAPIIRQDGQYALAIQPRQVLAREGDETILKSFGVPFGSYPRVMLIHILSEAVRKKSRHIELGQNLTDWMRRLGYPPPSYGPRGTIHGIRDQMNRLMACEWQIRWDGEQDGESVFQIRGVQLSTNYVGLHREDGSFNSEIQLSEAFYEHLQEHAVPLDERAIAHIKDSPTALDLYTYLSYRLPRIGREKPAVLRWDQLAAHMGIAPKHLHHFRNAIRRNWALVSAAYPDARADFGRSDVILMYASPPPIRQRVVSVPTQYQLISTPAEDGGAGPKRTTLRRKPVRQTTPTRFPKGSLSFGGPTEELFRKIGIEHGGGYDVDKIAEAYRAMVGDDLETLEGARLIRSFTSFCESYVKRRSNLEPA